MLASPVFGSRTWICTIAAPALAASSAEVAICSGVTGTAGFLPTESADPVTAQEIITLRIAASRFCCRWGEPSALRGSRIRGPRALRGCAPCTPLCAALSPVAPVPLERIRTDKKGRYHAALAAPSGGAAKGRDG